jgi:AcrR family transcriptional regulator
VRLRRCGRTAASMAEILTLAHGDDFRIALIASSAVVRPHCSRQYSQLRTSVTFSGSCVASSLARSGVSELSRTNMTARRVRGAAFDAFVKDGPGVVTMARIARSARVPEQWVREHHDSKDALYRAAVVDALLRAVGELRSTATLDLGPPSKIVAAQVEACQRMFASDLARDIGYLLIRDQARFSWLEQEFRNCIIAPAAADLCLAITRAGRRTQMDLTAPRRAVERTLTRLFWRVVLPRLVPGATSEPPEAPETLVHSTAGAIIGMISAVDVDIVETGGSPAQRAAVIA